VVPVAGMYRKSGRADRRYVIDDYEIAYAPSATLQHICKERSPDKTVRRTPTAVGNPGRPVSTAVIKPISERNGTLGEGTSRERYALRAHAREIRSVSAKDDGNPASPRAIFPSPSPLGAG
jgi:hypothetical protein